MIERRVRCGAGTQGRGRLTTNVGGLLTAAIILLAWVTPGRAAPVEEVAPGVFIRPGVHEPMTAENAGAIANAGVVVGERTGAVIDPGGSVEAGEALLAMVRERTTLPVSHVIVTHMHPDHAFGTAAFLGARQGGADPILVGHRRLAAALAARIEGYREANRPAMGAMVDRARPLRTDLAVEGHATVDLGGRTLALRAWPTAHTDNDLTVLDEATGTLFAGDLLFAGHLPALDGSLTGWLAAMEELAALPAERVVPGHGPAAMDWPEALGPQRAYLEGLAASLRAAIAEGEPMAEAVERIAPPRGWKRVETFHRRNLTAGYAELEWE